MTRTYSQGICGDGAAILKDGQPMTVDEIVAALNAKTEQTAQGEAVALFDSAVAAELPLVSHVEYDSHEICKHFASKVRERMKSMPDPPPAPSVPDQRAEPADCPDCDGDGYVPTYLPCSRCGMTGCRTMDCGSCGGTGKRAAAPTVKP